MESILATLLPGSATEAERTFHMQLNALKRITKTPESEEKIIQIYIDEDWRLTILEQLFGYAAQRRICKRGDELFTHTRKANLEGNVVRYEDEERISRKKFQWLRFPKKRGFATVEKTRYTYPFTTTINGRRVELVAEVDDFHRPRSDLVVLEVENPNIVGWDANDLLPNWLYNHTIKEVSCDPQFRNYAIAQI